jgi:hypothetical protein
VLATAARRAQLADQDRLEAQIARDEWHLAVRARMARRLRGLAHRRGLVLVSSRVRDPAAPGYGRVWLHRSAGGGFGARVAGGRTGLTLDEAEAWLTSRIG